MYLSVAIQTGFAYQPEVARAPTGGVQLRIPDAVLPGMPGCNMALLTQQWLAGNQHVVIYRAVWCMAIGAVILDRFVLKQKRTTLFRVATVTGFIHRGLKQHRRAFTAMCVMAIRAGNHAFRYGVSGKAKLVDSFILVTAKAYFLLFSPDTDAVLCAVYVMAAGTGDIRQRMFTGMPLLL